MKKQFRVMPFILFIFLIGCTENKGPILEKPTATIKPAELTQKNQNIINSIGVKDPFIFDLTINDPNQKFIKTWIDHYKNGEIQESAGEMASSIEEKLLTIVFAKNKIAIDKLGTYEQWNTSIVSEKGFSSSESHPIKAADEMSGKATSHIGDEIEVSSNEPYTVALVVIDDGNSIALSLDALNESEDEVKNYVKQYDEVFLYRVMVSENDPYKEK